MFKPLQTAATVQLCKCDTAPIIMRTTIKFFPC